MKKDMKNTENTPQTMPDAQAVPEQQNAERPVDAAAVQTDKRPAGEPRDVAAAVYAAAVKADLSAKDAKRMGQLLEPVAKGEVDEQIVTMLAQALNRDEDLKNADAAGYVRGKNEKIDIVNHFDGGEAETRPVNFPLYNKRGFWDDMR